MKLKPGKVYLTKGKPFDTGNKIKIKELTPCELHCWDCNGTSKRVVAYTYLHEDLENRPYYRCSREFKVGENLMIAQNVKNNRR